MNTPARAVTTLLLAALLAACGQDDPAPAPAASGSNAEPKTTLGRAVGKAIDEARAELAKKMSA
jgi:type IV pilus biogenesis protein CpaD/CtpE